MNEYERIQQRMDGRQMGRELFALIEGDTASIPYMESLVEEIELKAGLLAPSEAKEHDKREPIARLGAHVLDYGEFAGRSLDEIPRDRLDWYCRKAEENAKVLGAYLKHPDLESRRRGCDP